MIWLVMVVLTSSAQLTPSILFLGNDSSYRNSQAMMMLDGWGMVGGNAVDMQFIRQNVVGGNISGTQINRLADRSFAFNRAGFALQGGLQFWSFGDTLFGKPQWGLKIQVNTNYHASLSYTDKLFQTIYQGNAQFAGDTVALGPLGAQYQSWQKFGIGFFNKRTLNSIAFSLVAGEKYHSLLVQNADLYTSPTGDSLSLNYAGDYYRSDTLKHGWANGSGLGLALDMDYNLPLADRKGVISIALRDLGFIAWNKRSEQIAFDSLTTWKGIEANNLFDLATDTLDLPNLKDSIHHTTTARSFVAILPMSLHVRFSKYFTANDYYELGVSIWPNRAAVPLVYIGMNHRIGDHFIFSEKISYGGYGGFGVGAEMQWMPQGNWLLKLGTHHLGGFTMNSAHSRDFTFTVGRVLRKIAD